MIKKIYLYIRYLTIFFIAALVALMLIAAYPDALPILAKKYIQGNGVSYSKIEGSLLSGAVLYDVNYSNAIRMKRLDLEFNLFLLFKLTPLVSEIRIDRLSVNPANLPKSEGSNKFSMFDFELSKLSIHDANLSIANEDILFDLTASDILYKDELNAATIKLQLSSVYGEAKVQGSVVSNHLKAPKSRVTLEKAYRHYLDFMQGIPKTLLVGLDASIEEIKLETYLEDMNLTAEENIGFSKTHMDFLYRFGEHNVSIGASYFLSYETWKAEVSQQARVTTNGNYSSQINTRSITTPIAMPFTNLTAKLLGDKNHIQADVLAGPLKIQMKSDDYKAYFIDGKSSDLSLSFIKKLPDAFKNDLLTLDANALLKFGPLSMDGNASIEGEPYAMKGGINLTKAGKRYWAKFDPKLKSDLWQGYGIERFSPMNVAYYDSNATDAFTVDAKMLSLSLFQKDKLITGSGKLGSSHFDILEAKADHNDSDFLVSLKVPSLDNFMDEFSIKDPKEKIFVDAELDVTARLKLTDTFEVRSRIDIPWYIIKPDSRTIYKGEKLFFELTAKDNETMISRYSIDIMHQNIYSNKPSLLNFDSNGSILFKEFWIYDNLRLSGKMNPLKLEGDLHLQSDRFTYTGKEGKVTVKADINADFDRNGTQKIEGKVTLLEGLITYEPNKDYTISDDIIIIQDIKPLGTLKRYMNIQIDSSKPITYKSKSIDVKFVPNIILWQEPRSPIVLLGMLGIQEGKVKGGGKEFEFEKSEIYFNGANPINPFLNLNLNHHTLDDIEIEIFISNTMASPVVILSSTPSMNQNDIMSYILFGKSATTNFEPSSEGTSAEAISSLLLATGLKQILNDSTGMNIDTLNIITNQEGTLGYEIGTRFNKNIRIVYKSDTTSSVVLQYSVNKSVRIDVDAYEKGQGVTLLYIKDF